LLSVIAIYTYCQSENVSNYPKECEVFVKKGPVDRIKRFKALKDLEGELVTVCILNKKREVAKTYKGFVANLSSDIVRRGNLHTVLMLGERKKNGKISRSQFATNDPNTRIYLEKCVDN
ncbi:MAG: hypothetical protein AAF391_04000, partial [Bacteroidota bacterium]